MLAQTLCDIGFVSTIADPDVWIQPAACKDGYKCYEMLLVYYIDNVLAVLHELKVLIDAIGDYYKVRPGSDKDLISILGRMLRKCKCQMAGEFGQHLLVITSRMLSRLLKVYLRKTKKGM
jgi:hypothetical protein